MKPFHSLLPISATILGYACYATPRPSAPPRKISFGRDVRPILSEHCFKCHGPDVGTAAAGLRLDSFEGYTKKLQDGAAVVPGNPSASKLIERVSEPDPEMRMPPPDAHVSALTPEQIGILRDWITQGAHWEKHWSFLPPAMPKIPAVSDQKWAKNPIDDFVLAKLDAAGLKPEPEADRDTLAMRAAQTLTGLPPSPADLAAFRKDSKPGAYERYVDRLMSRPEYGEHEARYWLDAVRYGDTHGLQLDNERGIYPYRDWVVRAFNQDLPYDKFVQWQLAGDLLKNPTNDQMIATGYVRMNLTTDEGGAIAEEFLARNTFDRVDTTSTVLMGLTVQCAKCHDHKYDPIKQNDYYGLYAYFDSTQDDPLDGNATYPPPVMKAPSPEEVARLAELDSSMERLAAKVDPGAAATWFVQNQPASISDKGWEVSPVYDAANFDQAFDMPHPGEPGQPDPAWKPLTLELGKNVENLIGKDHASDYVRGELDSARDQSITLRVSSDDGVRVWLNGKLVHSHKVSRGLAAGPDFVPVILKAGANQLVAKVVNDVAGDGLNIAVGDSNADEISQTLNAFRKAPNDPTAQMRLREAFLKDGPSRPDTDSYRKLAKMRESVDASIPMTLIAREMPKPRTTYILKRGQYDQKGDEVQRHIPKVLGDLPPGEPNDRLGLADWLIRPSNPLVSRVFVNRVWQQHFGTGIVKTVDDFGSQGEWPENQPLLDYLAVTFVKNGWSVKALNRLIVTSAAFRQSSRITRVKLAKDPENRLISRGPRFRLDAEVIRDKALADGGLLVEQLGGRGFKPYQPDGLWEGSSDPASGTHVYVQDHGGQIYRRSLYMFWKRTSPPPAMVTFDAPLRDTCIVRRSATNTPLQALALLNEPAFLEASRTMAARVLTVHGDDGKRLKALYDLTMGRAPHPYELAVLEKALSRYRGIYDADRTAAQKLLKVGESPQSKTLPPAEQASWMLICSSLMNTNEFITQH